ncbi:MAG TPA: alpha-N-acetylglucosaminidase TIM-barrel domain-containing protein [Candidatus Latescibacteria bacterium]|nr:alpha-N-acetylglucosaminidase TIM-barrel domain-containing protein [Candidatus Latescibacterota bacterium]HOS64667.1 alpha-N-acetylglucosaminidase TIM-barrel domain-containing protein [Candidatus Latescibacterota bacterium]HPK73665.1 alpha-N-acetylglucosaminidase TIM-barrel domain-containing protein [Candidatus Latescibacterota bacterium]
MVLVDKGAPCSVVVSGAQPTWLERHAAEELVHYLRLISGAALPTVSGIPDGMNAVVIGRADTNSVVAEAVHEGVLSLSEDSPGWDGFVIKTARRGNRDVCFVGGSSDRGTLYAVYWLLEEVLGVGFFRDGEYIPRSDSVVLPESLHIVERPVFEHREDGLLAYSAKFWGWDEWKRELDWKAKRRANITWPFSGTGEITQAVLAEWGLNVSPPVPSHEPTLTDRLLDYAHKLGIRVPCHLPSGSMPSVFWEAFPNARKLVMQWSEYAPYTQLHPSDPLYKRFMVDFVRHYRERYGSDHLYIAEFASESRILQGAENVQEARIQFVKAICEALSEADPEGTWLPSSWSFDLSADDPGNPWQANWTVEQVREYLDAATYPLIVWDTWSEEAAKYERTDYFYGHPWAFSVLHCFGGETYLLGNVKELIRRAHALGEKPQDVGCVGFNVVPENSDYNSFYFELAARLQWNPRAVDLDEYVQRYCRLRYGPQYVAATEPVWRLLVETVYGEDSGTVKIIMDPLYWFRPDLRLLAGWPEDDERTIGMWRRRSEFIPKLRRAAELLLAAGNLVGENNMARRDLVDIARQWIAERFNQALIGARDAFLAGNGGELARLEPICLRLLDDQARLLASWPAYRLSRQVAQVRDQYPDPVKAVKLLHVWCNPVEGQESVPLRDYYRMDLDELVADYYKPRVAAYFALLRDKCAAGETTVTDEEFDAVYTPVERAFVAAPLCPLPDDEDPTDVAQDLLEDNPE